MIIKFIKKKLNLIKICAVFTTVCFVVSTLGANLYAIPLAENANQKYEDVFNKASSISAEYGKITSSKDAQSDITVINIQDLHCHPQTQRNISKIIAQIAEKYNLKEIYVEGGYGNIDLNWLSSIKDENIRKQVTEKLLEDGLLTGSEYYKLTCGNKDIELKGIDEEELHRENVKRLAWIIENQDKYKDVIKKVENEINTLEKIYVNSRNERFNRDIEKYLTNKIDSRRFYRQLAKYVKDINANPDKYNNITAIRLEDYPNIVKFITLRKISKDIDVRKVTQQLQVVINELKNRLPYNIYTQLLKETENLSDSQKVVELITLLCKKEGIDLEYRYKALNEFLQSNEINRELNTVELVYEERQLITEIRKALSYNNEEYEITFVSDFSRFFKDYLEYKLTDADWKYFEKGYEQFRQLYAKYATVDRIKEIDGDISELNKYYGINDIRNEVFVNNLLQDKHPNVVEQSKYREDEEILKGSKEVIIAVTGGFHSNALEDILQAKEVNTIVITPSIFEGIEKATKQYKGIIKEQSKEFQHQALAYRILSSLPTQEQKVYLYGALKALIGNNLNKLKEVLGEDVDLDSLERKLQNLQLSDEQSQLNVSVTVKALEIAVDLMIKNGLLPKEGGKAIFAPNVSEIMWKASKALVDAKIFLSKGPIFVAEQQGLPEVRKTLPEDYSRMSAIIQEALFAQEGLSVKEGDESIKEEESAVEDDIQETEEPETVKEDKEEEKVEIDTSKVTTKRREELLGKFYNNNTKALNLLINVCCRKLPDSDGVLFDVTKDSRTLDMFIRKFNSYNYSLEQMESIIIRSAAVSERFFFDTDLKFSCFEKFVDYFDIDDIGDNGQPEYINSFTKLFSLKQEYLELFYEKIDGAIANEILFYFTSEEINNKLNFLSERYSEELSKLDDYSKLIEVFSNMEKLDYSDEELKAILDSEGYDKVRYTQKGLFAHLMSLPKDISDNILKTSTTPSQFIKKLIASKRFYFIGQRAEIRNLLFDNADKFYGLDPVDFSHFSGLNNEAISLILKYARNSSDIKNILSFYQGMGLSTEFDGSENVKDFKDPRFKALVKYISVGDRNFYVELFKYDTKRDKKIVKLIVDSVDDGEFVRDYLLNPEYRDIYKNLFDKLTHLDLDLKNIAVENNYLALKLILDKNFNRMLTESRLDNISDRDNIVARYYSAIAVSRIMYDGAERELKNYSFNDEQFVELMKKTTDIYIRMMKAMLNIILLDSNTKIYAICNSERAFGRDRFNIDTLKEIIEYMGISIEIPEENVYRRVGNNTNASEGLLNAIETFTMDSEKTKGYFVARCHGGEESLLIYDPSVKDNGLATGNKAERITPEQMATSLFKLATRTDNPVDLRNITIDLSCCNSYFFARNVYRILEQKYEEKGIEGTYPTIITAAGLETRFGITDFKYMEGNLHKGIKKLLRNFQKGSVPVLSLGMIGVSEYLFRDSNITMFTSFFNKTILRDLKEIKKEIHDYVNLENTATEQQSEISEKEEEISEQVVGEGSGKLSSVLPLPVTEASIFKEDNYAPIWEEVVYRFAPALIFTILISVTMMFAPVGFVLFTKMGFAVILTLFQTIFVKAHIVTDWLRAKDSGGEKSSEEVPETSISDKQSKTVDLGKVFEKDLTFEDKINKIFKTVKERLFAVFSDSKDAESFKIFYKTNKIAAEHKDGLIIPTIAFTIPYVVVMCFFPSIQAVMIATIVSMALHAINNIVAKIIKEKGLLQKKQKDIDFQDIKRRIKHVKLLLENPQVKRDLSELKEGYFALKFALENKDSRRAEYLLDFEKIRIHFIDTLDKEKENTIAEIERIEKKKRITRKDREKIQALREKSSEYTRIRSELLNDTSKVEETIKKIDNLLSVFEEVDIILDMIENFKAENGNIRETRILERDFLDFAENTFMKELMSLYDGKVSGIHVNRIVSSSRIFGTKMHFGNNVRMMYKLMLSSILHDIGKNIIPKTILNKQGSFDDLERNIMEMHVVFGGLILRSSILKSLSYTAENHHFTKEGLPRSYSFKTKIDELLNSKDGKTKNLYSAIAYSLDGEYENIIAQIVAFLKELNPQLSLDSESQYPRNLDDIKNILKDMNIDLTESQQEKLDPLLQEIKRMEDERFIAKIVTLLDVYEAVSPKLSFDTERTYQFPRQIRDISNMLENIDMYIELTDSQKREVIILLTEIAQIDSEEDESKKQDLERNFIKKVLYDRSKSVVIKYIREQNYKNVRENAFKIIFTKSPEDIFKELGKTEEEFMKDFEKNPKEIIDKCMSLVDTSALEFDPEVVRVFLDFYFNFDDVKVNNTIIDNLNKKKENRFIVHIKDVLYSLYKLQRSVNRMLVRFTPVIASVFHGLGEQEKDISVKDLFDIDTEIINHDVLIRKSDGEIYILHFDEKSFEQKGRRFAGVTMLPKNYGIKEIEYDENGRISNVILEGGTRIEPLFTEEEKEKIEREQGKLVGNKENNLPFEDFILDSIKENIREITGNNVAETVDIYLDSETVISDMETAIKENKLMIIHVFEEGFKTKDLSLRQLYEKYNQILSLINGGFEAIFSENTKEEDPTIEQIKEGLNDEEKKDFEWTKRETAKALFSLREILKNDFDHGNNGLIEYPIALYISKNEEGKVSDIITYNAGAKSTDIDSIDKKTLSNLIYESYISGSKKGAKYMESSLFINFEDGFISTDGAEGKYKIHRTRVTLKSKQEQEDALAKYNQYIQENRQKELEKQQRLAKMSEEEKEAALRRDAESTHAAKMAEFWDDFISILKPFGWKLGEYPHVWEEIVFRYLPLALILSVATITGISIQLVSYWYAIQFVFVLAHPIAKWVAARMKLKEAQKKGERVGEKIGIGDLFKQIDKTNLSIPTLAMMLPYAGVMISFAINPVLSLVITPALITFTDVIVQWLTRKDSGGEVSINKNVLIVSVIASLVSYTLLPFIPVIHPLVNALINPIVITNFFGAGYLHHEYNKRQKDRSKLLSIFSSSLSEARKAELLAKLDNNEEALNSLIKICREESINFDLSKDTPLTDLKIACFKKYSSFLTDEFDGKNPELKRINFFRRLFSLSEDNLEFLYNEIDNFGVELLLLDTDDADYEADDIDANLTTLLSVHKEELLKLAKTDYETFPDTLYNFLRPSNIKKVTSLSKEDFAYLISPSMVKHYNTILLLSKDSSQLKIKLAANKAFGFTMRDIKQEILRKILTIFDNVKDLSDIEKILQLCEENKISSDFDSSKGVEDFKDMRFKAFVRYVSSTDDKSFYNNLFKFYGKKTVFNWKGEDSYDKKDQRILKIIVDSIDDISFIKEYLLNSDRNKIYKTLFAGLADLDIKKVAVENDHLALKLLIDENFNKILNDSRIHDNVPQEKILVARYHAAIAVSRFIYDSVENEVAGYDLSNDEIKEQIGKITELYIEAVRQAGKIVIMDSQTKIYGLFNDEIMEGTERFNEEAILKMLEIIREANPNQKLPAPTFYKRNDRDHGSEAAKSWLDAMEDLILESTQKKQEKAYFVFRGHGEHKDNEDPDKSDYLKVNGSEKIYAKELAERLFNLATRQGNPVDLRRVTIDLSCCDSYFFARSVHKYLEQMYEEYAKTNKGFKETFPIIISAGGLEERSGITIDIRKISDSRKKLGNTKWIGNLHEGILQILDGKSELTLGMLALSEYKFLFSNITIFASFDDEMTKEIEKVRKNTLDVFGKYSIGTQTDKTESQLTQEGEKQETAETKRNVGGEMTVPALHAGRMEMSILKPLNLKREDRPYIWEEGLFRYLPAALILSHIINPIVGIGVQLLFISAHSIVKWGVARKDAKEKGEKVGIGDLFKQIGKDIKNLGLPTLAMMLPYVGSLLAFAINPALSILITPTFFMFADVIVQWITKKDSGGKITINKNLVVAAVISSLLAYTVLPVIPVINPLVNALINPILAVNTAGAGYLHFEYNKRQKDRSKSLNILSNISGKTIDGLNQSNRARNRVTKANQPFGINYFFKKNTVVIHKEDGSQQIIDFSSKCMIPVYFTPKPSFDEYFAVKEKFGRRYELGNNYTLYDIDGNEVKLGNKPVQYIRCIFDDNMVEIEDDNQNAGVLPDGEYILKKDDGTENHFIVQNGQTTPKIKTDNAKHFKKVRIEPKENAGAGEITEIELVQGTPQTFKVGEIQITLNISSKNRLIKKVNVRTEESSDEQTAFAEQLQKLVNDISDLEQIEIIDQDRKLLFKFTDGTEQTLSVPTKDQTIYIRHNNYVFASDSQYVTAFEIDTRFFEETTSDDILNFKFKDGIDYADVVREYVLDEFANRNVLVTGDKTHILYFDAKTGDVYAIKNVVTREKITPDKYADYGIVSFSVEGGKITELALTKDFDMQIDVRQPIGMEDTEINADMEQLAKSIGKPDSRPPIVILRAEEMKDYSSDSEESEILSYIPKDFIKNFFGKIITENPDELAKVKNFIDVHISDDKISPEELEQVFKDAGILEEDAKMYVERILTKYVYDVIAENLKDQKRREILLSVFTGDRNSLDNHIRLANDSSSTDFKEEFLKSKFGLEIDKKDLEGVEITEQYIIKKLIEKKRIQISTVYQMKQILSRSGLNQEQIGKINFDSDHPLQDAMEQYAGIREKLNGKNYQGKIKLEDINFDNPEEIIQILEKNPLLYSMFMETLIRTFESLNVQGYTNIKITEETTLRQALKAISEVIDGEEIVGGRRDGSKLDKKFFEAQLRGIFGEVYCMKTIVAGQFDGVTLRLQMAESANEPGIDLINPVTGLKIQIKTGLNGEVKLVNDHFKKYWQDGGFFVQGYGLGHRKIPVFTVGTLKAEINRNASNHNDLRVQSFGIDGETIKGWTEYLFDYVRNGDNLDEAVITNRTVEILDAIGITYTLGTKLSVLMKKLEELHEDRQNVIEQVVDVEEIVAPSSPTGTDGDNAILPENMGLVNRIMQSTFGNAFIAATAVAFREFFASFRPDFVNLHQSAAGIAGAQELVDFINGYKITDSDGIIARTLKTLFRPILKFLFAGASIVKHIAIDYRYIKASGIQEAISMFGNNTYMDEYGQIHIPPVLIVDDLTGLKDLSNTGIKVNGRYIYQVGQKGILIYGAEGVNSEDISMAVNESQMIKNAIEQMIREKGYEGVSVEVDGVIQEEGEGVRFDKGITIIGTEELQNQSATYIDAYVSSSIELKRTVGVMYSQKALISLEGLEKDFENKEKDSKKLEEYLEKLKQALYQGRARKIISKTQYNQLQLTSEDIMELRKNGIEIYIDSNEIDMNLKSMGIVGQIVRNNDNQMLIYDYYAQEEVEIEEIGDEATLTDIENKLLNSPNPIMIDIKVLAKTFQRENVLTAYKGLNNLIGNMKLKTGIGELNKADIMSLGYNLDYNKLPQLSLSETKMLQEYTENEIENMLNTVISNLDTNTEIRIILKAIESRKKKAIKENKTPEEIKKIEEIQETFIQIMKERILAKTALTKNYKEFGLKDKKLEILLGEMLYKQLPFAIEDKDLSDYRNNVDITYINERNERVDVQGEKGLMEKIKQDTEKAMMNNDRVAINSIIDIILTYGDSYKEKQLTRRLDVNDARNYRAMLSAA